MREKAVFVLLLAMLAVFGVAVAMPGERESTTAVAATASQSVAGTSRKPAPRGDLHTVRVVAVGYDVLAPGIVANGGVGPDSKESAFRSNGVDARLRAVADDDAIAAALARGGDLGEGAHVAVLALPTLIAHEERLRALELSVVHVAAWSNGRHALHGPTSNAGSAIVDLGSDDAKRERIAIVGSREDPSAILALTLFDLAGADVSRIRWEEPGTAAARSAHWSIAGGSSALPTRGALVASTADAPRLIPYVIVAPAAEVRRDSEAIGRFVESWCDGAERLRRDPAGAARFLAEQPGAPDAVTLIEQLGELDLVGARESARVLGLAGRSPVTIDALHAHSARLLRDAGAAAPSPSRSLVAHEPIAYAVRARPDAFDEQRFSRERVARSSPLVHHETRARGDELVAQVAFLAGAFDAGRIGLSTPGHERGHVRLVGEVTARYDLDTERFTAADGTRARGVTIVEVY